MAPLPENNTGRLFIDYNANGRPHTLMLRYANAGAPTPLFLFDVDNWLQTLNPLMPTDWSFGSWRYSAQGTNFSVPLAGAPTAFQGIRTPRAYEGPAFITFVGRTLGGRRARVFLLGAGFDPSEAGGQAEDYRINAAEFAPAAVAIDALNNTGVVGIDGLEPAWYQYLNAGFNAYWQRKSRS